MRSGPVRHGYRGQPGPGRRRRGPSRGRRCRRRCRRWLRGGLAAGPGHGAAGAAKQPAPASAGRGAAVAGSSRGLAPPLAAVVPATSAAGLSGPVRSRLSSLSCGSISSIRAISRQAPGRVGPLPDPPRRAGAGRTRSLVRPPRRRARLPGALSFSVLVPSPTRTAQNPVPRPRPGLRNLLARAGRARAPMRQRSACRAVLAPAASPSAATTAPGPPAGGARSRCHRAGQQASSAEQPFEVWHKRRLAHLRHASLPQAGPRRRGHLPAAFPYWSGALPPRYRRRGTPRRPGPRPQPPPREGSLPRSDASSPRASIPPAAGPLVSSKTSITSIPLGRAASSRSRTSEAVHRSVNASSRYSASLAVPVCAPPA